MNPILRKASATWIGAAKGGTREITIESGALKEALLSSRISPKNASDTDSLELIAAAHVKSFFLALSKELRLKSPATGQIVATATLTVEANGADWAITNSHLTVVATLPEVSQGSFIDATVHAKTSCLISRLLHTNISMNARLETESKL